MWKNYFQTGLRSLFRNRLQSAINIIGLAAGLSAAILIILYVRSEQNYDLHHPNTQQIFRLNSHVELDGQTDALARNSLRAGPEIADSYAEVESFCRLMDIGKQTIWYKDKMFSEHSVCFADSSFFDLFQYEFIYGDPGSCLVKPQSIVLTRSQAEKYFGSVDVAPGELLKFTSKSYTVTGIVENPKQETHIPFNAFISINSMNPDFYQMAMRDYFRMMTFTYLKLKENIPAKQLSDNLESFYADNIGPWIKQYEVKGSLTFSLQPISSIHLNKSWAYDFPGNSNPIYVHIFWIVGFFILLVACINYMNLSTARASMRSKEIGIRLISGAGRRRVAMQFMIEAFLVSTLAFLLALAIIEFLFPLFNSLTDKSFSIQELFRGEMLIFLFGLLCLVSLLSGLYPALYLSRMQALDALRMQGASHKINYGWKRILSPVNLRKALVIVQFCIAGALIVATLIVLNQLDYMRSRDLGFDQNNILVIQVPSDSTVKNNLPTLKNEWAKKPEVKVLASSSNIPGGGNGELYFIVNQLGQKTNRLLGFMFVDQNFFPLLDIDLEGRNFREDIPSDAREAFIINEACARFLGWTDPIGMELENGFGMKGKVVGVVKDFNYASLHTPIKPMVFMFSPQTAANLMVKLNENASSETATELLDSWKSFVPNHPLESFYLDEFILRNYESENKMLGIFGYFTALTILISCLGLFGLASHSTEQRTKEIGIRKVLGENVPALVLRVSREFVLLVVLANILAWPLAYYFLDRWLESFAFHVSMEMLPFIFATFIALLISLLTVSSLAYKVAKANPIKALRYE